MLAGVLKVSILVLLTRAFGLELLGAVGGEGEWPLWLGLEGMMIGMEEKGGRDGEEAELVVVVVAVQEEVEGGVSRGGVGRRDDFEKGVMKYGVEVEVKVSGECVSFTRTACSISLICRLAVCRVHGSN